MTAHIPVVRAQSFLPEQLLEHGEELAYLWGRRRSALMSDTLTLPDLQHLQERIDAHMQGLLAAPAHSAAACFSDWFDSEDRDEVFVAATAYLQRGDSSNARQVLDLLGEADGPRCLGLRDALGHTPTQVSQAIEADLLTLTASDRADTAMAAAVALANLRRLPSLPARFLTWMQSEPADRLVDLWQLAAHLPASEASTTLPYREGLAHPDHAVRDACFSAACWRGEPWVAQYLANRMSTADYEALSWFAAIEEVGASEAWAHHAATLPASVRCQLIARAGHPEGIENLIELMSDQDPRVASDAGSAFSRLTGLSAEGVRQLIEAGPEADEFEREFADDVWLPDAPRARALWERHRNEWLAGRRWCRGHEVSSRLSSVAQRSIDMAARWDFGMRAALSGVRIMTPPPIV